MARPSTKPADQKRYKLMIRTPDFIGAADLLSTQKLLAKKGVTPRVDDLALETMEEGALSAGAACRPL